MKQIFYMAAVVILLFLAYRLMNKVKDFPPDENPEGSPENDELTKQNDEPTDGKNE
ncbi:MAG: hypothetical protein LBR64_10605 [Dysgonamonadaceae bacterium]|jgi:hypothetical protein|nr:hypothetical protein [Dysgonamonadaceae bacterium]